MVISLKHVGLIYPLYTYLRMWTHLSILNFVCQYVTGHTSTFDQKTIVETKLLRVQNVYSEFLLYINFLW